MTRCRPARLPTICPPAILFQIPILSGFPSRQRLCVATSYVVDDKDRSLNLVSRWRKTKAVEFNLPRAGRTEMPKTSVSNNKTAVERKRVEALLFPIAAFLRAGGWKKRDIERIFSFVYDKQATPKRVRRIEYIKYASHYEAIVSRWIHDKQFIDSRGKPGILPYRGVNSFSTLVKKVNPKANPHAILSVFKRYNTVRRVNRNRYELATPYFVVTNKRSIAFEPLAHFLSEASATLARILNRSNRSRGVESFWRMVDNTNLSEAAAKRFTVYVRERSQAFLEEMDDWLEVNSQSNANKPRQKVHRVGLGLFSIYSDFNDWRKK